MADVRPFRALRPADDLAADVIAPPYDVLTDAEARALASAPRSFVRVTRPEAVMAPGTDPHSEAAYQQARRNLDALIVEGVLREDELATYYFYGQLMGEHRQVGVLAGASVAEYDRGVIKRHETTRPDKEDDRTRHMEVLDAQVGLVFLTYRATDALRALTREVTAAEPAWRVTTDDGVEHALWPAPADKVQAIREAFSQVPALYIADGHHRSAAASRVHAQRQSTATSTFLAGFFPDDALKVMAYNRWVHHTGGLEPAALLEAIGRAFHVEPTGDPAPSRRGLVTAYLAGSWYQLSPKPEILTDDPVASLDVSLLQDHVLGPILGIEDPRRSQDISFIGGIRGHEALVGAVDASGGIAFHLYPTGLDQLLAVADAGEVMPPKSTWFEPKLREGVVSKALSR
ncbi:MAG: DUF1015 domain-containing protein [Deltaproteobacteria bacterium]|nr:MAG: DUF1015 domain-containing protein [Deltaproteobacteria bacterium]